MNGKLALVLFGLCLRWTASAGTSNSTPPGREFQTTLLDVQPPPITLNLAWCVSRVANRSVILMPGLLDAGRLPSWSTNLVREELLLVAFSAAHPPDPDPNRRPVWLHFSERFAHSYAQDGARAIADSRRVVDFLAKRSDVVPDKIGWLGSSSTAR